MIWRLLSTPRWCLAALVATAVLAVPLEETPLNAHIFAPSSCDVETASESTSSLVLLQTHASIQSKVSELTTQLAANTRPTEQGLQELDVEPHAFVGSGIVCGKNRLRELLFVSKEQCLGTCSGDTDCRYVSIYGDLRKGNKCTCRLYSQCDVFVPSTSNAITVQVRGCKVQLYEGQNFNAGSNGSFWKAAFAEGFFQLPKYQKVTPSYDHGTSLVMSEHHPRSVEVVGEGCRARLYKAGDDFSEFVELAEDAIGNWTGSLESIVVFNFTTLADDKKALEFNDTQLMQGIRGAFVKQAPS